MWSYLQFPFSYLLASILQIIFPERNQQILFTVNNFPAKLPNWPSHIHNYALKMHCGPDEPTLFDFSDNATRQFIHSLVLFQKAYAPIHGRICVCLCLFGVLTNLIHCVVLTRPQMRQSAVNAIMTAVALCDLGTMGSYLVYIWHFVLGDHSCANAQTRLWMFFLLLHIFLSILLHTATLWLAVLMAFLRRMTLHKNTLYSNWQRVPLARRASLGVVFAVFLLCIPSLAVHQVIEYPHHRWQPSPLCLAEKFAAMPNYSEPLFTVVIRPSALANGCWLFKGNLWLTGICFKVIPCLLLLVLSASLLQKLRRAERKRCMLLLSQIGNGTQNERAPSADVTQQMQNGPAGLKKINSDRTTALLLAILCVFLLTEMPQGLIAILNAVYTADVHRFIYLTLGDVLDLLSLLNSSVNFVLYCLMSSRYRQTFCSLFLPIQACKRCVAQAQSIPLPPSFQSQQPPPPPNPQENGQQQHEMAQSTDERGNHGFLAIGHRQRRRRSTPAYRWLRAGSQQSALSARDMEELSQRLGGRERSPALQQRLQQLKEEKENQQHHMSSMQHLLKPNAGF